MVLGTIVIAGVAFFGGMKYQETKGGNANSNARGQFAQRQGGQGRFGANANGRPVQGEITALDDTNLTVKLTDGSSKIVNISNSTTFSKTETGSKADLKVGTKVATFGTTNSDGSVTAQNVQINPMFRMMATTPSPQR